MIYSNMTFKVLIAIYLTGMTSCGIYSFSGASIPENAKTISVIYIANRASLIEPNLSNLITAKLMDKCQTETNLNLIESNGDIVFSGEITDYKIQPISIQNNETAAQNRLTISVEIIYSNMIDETENFKQKFSDFADFDSGENFSDIEIELNEIIIKNLVEDIFNQAFSRW